jgi:hypothetical protein
MIRASRGSNRRWSVIFGALLSLLFSPTARAHCDTIDGPIIPESKAPLENGAVTSVLKGIQINAIPLFAIKESGSGVSEI